MKYVLLVVINELITEFSCHLEMIGVVTFSTNTLNADIGWFAHEKENRTQTT